MNSLYVVGLFVAFLGVSEGSAVLSKEKDVLTEEPPLDRASETERLLNQLWQASSVGRRNTPPFVPGEAVNVEYGMSLNGVKSVDLETGIVELVVWERMTWMDNRLSWNFDNYGGLKEIRLPSSMIWTPDIMTYNSFVSDDHKFRGEVMAVVYNTGQVLYIPPTTKQIMCDINYSDQTLASCYMKIGSWTYSADLVDINFYGDEADLDVDNFVSNSFATIGNHTAARIEKFYPCCEEAYPSLDFTFDLVLAN